MREVLTRSMGRYQTTFRQFTAGQKVVAVIGTAALLLGGFMVFRWASAPTYAPLFSNLAPADASAVVNELDTQGVQYELADGGATIMVPRDAVYSTRIQLSGEGLPAASDGGYGILDDQGISTSEFKEKTDFKRAMEGELANTIEAIDGVNGAVVHLAIPEKDVFTDSQEPTTASVLVQTNPGATLAPEQVQAVVHLVASSIDGLDPDNVTVADSSGRVLSTPGGTVGAATTERTQQTEAYQEQVRSDLQAMLDRVVGPGNSTVQVTAELDFDKAVTETTDYQPDKKIPALQEDISRETYNGTGGGIGQGIGGVVGVDDQTDTGAGTGTTGGNDYSNETSSVTNGVDTVKETRETAPGALAKLNVGVVLDTNTTQSISATDVRTLVGDAVGIDSTRGDTVRVVQMPFDRTSEEAAKAELEASAKAEAAAARTDLIEKGAMVGAVLLVLLLALLSARRKNKKREQATTYVVEQLRQERQAIEPPPAALALTEVEQVETSNVREELSALIERQPDDVAQLLRGWLVER
jgi:flagellar M-ring protein FliF